MKIPEVKEYENLNMCLKRLKEKIKQTDEDNPELMTRNIFRLSKSCPRTA